MRKRLTAFVLTLAVIFTMVPCAFADNVCESISGTYEIGTSVTFTATASKKLLGRRITFTQTKGTYHTNDDNDYQSFAPYRITLTVEGTDEESKTYEWNDESRWFWLDMGKTYTITVTAVDFSGWVKFVHLLPQWCPDEGVICQPVLAEWITPTTWTVEARDGISLCKAS